MAFDYGVVQYKNLVNLITDKFIASHSSITDIQDVDPGYWTGTDVDPGHGTEHWTRRCVKTIRHGETLYISFQEPWYDATKSYIPLFSSTIGVLMSVSTTYSMLNHALDSPIQNCMIPLGQHITDRDTILDEYITYWRWVDEGAETNAGAGFCMVIKPNPWNGGYTQTAIVNVENFDPNMKEYNDGMSNWWLMSFPNYWETTYESSGYPCGWIIHPFSHAHPGHSSHYDDARYYYDIRSTNMRFGVFGLDIFMRAYRSGGITGEGDNKVRYSKPILHAHADYNYYPQLQLNHFIMWETEGGMVDGDVLQEEGSNKKFLLLNKDSSSSTNTLPIGILYEV